MAEQAERAAAEPRAKEAQPRRAKGAEGMPVQEGLQRRAAAREAGYGALLNSRPLGPRPTQPPAPPNRTGLPDRLKAGVEALSGMSMDGVKVHYNSSKPAQLDALAYAQGSDIHLAPGQEKHLPHEAWHVVQQAQGRVRPTMQMKEGVPVNDNCGLEREADLMGARALARGASVPDRGVRSAGRAQEPVRAGRTGPVAQRWLDPALLAGRTRDRHTKDLAQQALAYNSDRRGKSRADRIDEIQALHVAAMKWLDDYRVPDQNVSGAALWAKELMNAAQQEQRELVQTSIAQNDAQPPVANFASLSQAEQAFVTQTWQQLVADTGNVRITETETYTNQATKQADSRVHQGFRDEVLAQFARLLETATGRDVVAQVNRDTGGAKLVTVKPGFSESSQGAPAKEFAASPTATDSSDKLTEVDPATKFKGQTNAKKRRAAYLRRFVEIDLDAIVDPKLKAKAIYDARKANPTARGVKMAGKHYEFGRGTGVDVDITRDMRDAEDHHTSRFVDDERNEIPTPNFITLGHELGHAAHMLTGVALGENQVSDDLLAQVGIQGRATMDWSNMEEYANINAVENELRGEYGMKARFGHINQAVVQKTRLNPIADELDALSRLQPIRWRPAVAVHLGQANQASGGMKIAELRAALKAAADAFAAQMAQSFPGFTPQETMAIKAQLTLLGQKIPSAREDVLGQALAAAQQAVNLTTQANARVQNQAAQQQGGSSSRFWPFG